MRPRTDVLVSLAVLLTVVLGMMSPTHLFGPWQIFVCYLCLSLIGACFKVAMPGGEIALSFNVPYILLSIMWLPLPAVLVVAAASALMICTFRVSPRNTLAQILFHLANAVNSSFVAWYIYYAAKNASGQSLPSLVAAAMAYFVVNTISAAAVLATLRGKPLFGMWRHSFWAWPYYPVSAALALFTYYVEVHRGQFTAQLVLPVAYVLYRICKSYYSGRLVEHHKHAEDMAALHLRTIEALALAIEAKDQNTHDHLCRVRVYAAGIAAAMKLNDDETEALMAAALLHDIGKLAVPEYIINKPGKLTPEEFDRMKIHPVVGAQILARVSFPYPVVPIVRSHHEHWDGSGYPDGLKGEEIPVGARILAVIDCFDAMASDRPYRRALPISGAVAHVQKLAGIEFDPRVVSILAQLHDELEGKALAESRKMEPLKTDITVRRGKAPSAGYERSGAAPGSGPGASMDPSARARFENGIKSMIAETLQAGGPADTLACVSATLAVVIPFDILMIYVLEGEVLRPYYASGNRAVSLSSAALPVGLGLCGWVAQSRQHILNGNPSVEVEIQTADARISQMHSCLALPLVNHQDSVLGVLALYQSERDAFSADHLDFLLSLQASFTGFLARVLPETVGSVLNQSQLREEETSGVAIV
jgi:putative nucleotidyltransferase with HDIG domain